MVKEWGALWKTYGLGWGKKIQFIVQGSKDVMSSDS